jgi:hypothetical protein
MLVARMERAHGPLTSPSAPAFKDGYAAVFRLGVALRNLKRYLDAERWLSTALRLHQQVRYMLCLLTLLGCWSQAVEQSGPSQAMAVH